MPENHGKVDPAEALMREVGAQLREVRLERGEDLDEVAEYLRIKAAYLYGIEQGDLSMMPGRTYALGFLRSYADHLGFDGDDLITQIRWTVDNLTSRTRLQIRTPLPESRLPKMPVLVLSLAVLAGAYAGWSYMNRSSDLVVETVAEVPDSLRRMAMETLPGTGPEQAAPPVAAEVQTSAPSNDAALEGSDEPEAPLATTEPPADADIGVARGPQLEPSGIAALPEGDAEDGGATVAQAPEAPAPAAAPDEEQETVDLEILPSTTPLTGANAARSLPAEPPNTREAVERPTRTALASDLAGDGSARAPTPEAGPETRPQTRDRATGVPMAVLPPGGAPADAAAPAGAAAVLPDGAAALEEEPADATSAAAVVAALTGQAIPEQEDADGDGPQVLETVNTDARVILRANDSSWVHISNENGDYLRTRTLETGDVFLVPNRPDLQLWTGNAGGLDVFVDGEELAPLGPLGAVVRNVPLDAERLKSR